jgi:hypothetical protein
MWNREVVVDSVMQVTRQALWREQNVKRRGQVTTWPGQSMVPPLSSSQLLWKWRWKVGRKEYLSRQPGLPPFAF